MKFGNPNQRYESWNMLNAQASLGIPDVPSYKSNVKLVAKSTIIRKHEKI